MNMIPMTVSNIANAVECNIVSDHGDVTVRGISTDSRHLTTGDLFVAIRGETFNGHDFIEQAFQAGAAACMVNQSWYETACNTHCDAIDHALHDIINPSTHHASNGDGNQIDHPSKQSSELNRPERDSYHRTLIVVQDTVEALGLLAAHYRRHVMNPKTTVIALTGSNGKTTTKEMIHHVLSTHLRGTAAPASFNNDIGVPLTLLSACMHHDYLVVEIGSNAPGEIEKLSQMVAPDIAVITSIGHAHVSGLGGLGGIATEKASMLQSVGVGHSEERLSNPAGRFAVIPSDSTELLKRIPEDFMPTDDIRSNNIADAEISSIPSSQRLSRLLCTVGSDGSSDVCVSVTDATLDGTLIIIDDCVGARLRFPGRHFANSAAMAYVVGRRMGISADTIVEQLDTFQPPNRRMSVVEHAGLKIIDDCYNSNPSSMEAAIDVLNDASHGSSIKRRVIIMGDMLELGSESDAQHERMGTLIARSGIDVLITVGQASRMTADVARQSGIASVSSYDRVEDAVTYTTELLMPGDVALIKGSRAMNLERVVDALTQSHTMSGDQANDEHVNMPRDASDIPAEMISNHEDHFEEHLRPSTIKDRSTRPDSITAEKTT